jgi:hypothetical protein
MVGVERIEEGHDARPVLVPTTKLSNVLSKRYIVCHVDKVPDPGKAAGAKTSVTNVTECVARRCAVAGIDVELDPRRAAIARAGGNKEIFETDLVREGGNLCPRKHVAHCNPDGTRRGKRTGRGEDGNYVVVGILGVLIVDHGEKELELLAESLRLRRGHGGIGGDGGILEEQVAYPGGDSLNLRIRYSVDSGKHERCQTADHEQTKKGPGVQQTMEAAFPCGHGSQLLSSENI